MASIIQLITWLRMMNMHQAKNVKRIMSAARHQPTSMIVHQRLGANRTGIDICSGFV